MQGIWSYPDTPGLRMVELILREALTQRQHAQLLYSWEEWTIRYLLAALTRQARERFVVPGDPYPWPYVLTAN